MTKQRKQRGWTVGNLLDMKHQTMQFDGVWKQAMDDPENCGMWLIYGKEKNGKTSFALMLAKYLAGFGRVLYVSAEEENKVTFQRAVGRAGLNRKDRITFTGRKTVEELEARLNDKTQPPMVIIDNMTVYQKELTESRILSWFDRYGKSKIKKPNGRQVDNPNKRLIIFLAHEKRNQPDPPIAEYARRLTSIYCRVRGFTATVSGRCSGGTLTINKEKAEIIYGESKP